MNELQETKKELKEMKIKYYLALFSAFAIAVLSYSFLVIEW